MIADAFGMPISSLFVSFDEKSIASGAIAQIHKATIERDGKIIEVAIKIRHPNTKYSVLTDLAILNSVGKFVSGTTSMNRTELFHSFISVLKKKIDESLFVLSFIGTSGEFRSIPKEYER
jgi:predicted unusual protein kinase regulating ubiquinone biosynthesis (AarF/ABC1/UbiB family)